MFKVTQSCLKNAIAQSHSKSFTVDQSCLKNAVAQKFSKSLVVAQRFLKSLVVVQSCSKSLKIASKTQLLKVAPRGNDKTGQRTQSKQKSYLKLSMYYWL
jgi:hypothetical protein